MHCICCKYSSCLLTVVADGIIYLQTKYSCVTPSQVLMGQKYLIFPVISMSKCSDSLLHETSTFFNETMFPAGLLRDKQDLTRGWGACEEVGTGFSLSEASWTHHINVNMLLGRRGKALWLTQSAVTWQQYTWHTVYLYTWVSLYKLRSFYYRHVGKSELIWRLN